MSEYPETHGDLGINILHDDDQRQTPQRGEHPPDERKERGIRPGHEHIRTRGEKADEERRV
jgi:hypothetical protein